MTTCAKCKLEIPPAELVKCAECGMELHKKCSRKYGAEKLRYCRKCLKDVIEDNPTWVGMG